MGKPRETSVGTRRAAIAGVAGLIAAGSVALGYVAMPAQAQIAVQNQGYVPFSDAPIFYRSAVNDPVAVLQKQLDEGKVKLTYEKDHGYLKSVLKLLKVPVSSQTLVFSKTSFQYPHITPDHPRALYYNDDVYVGAVHNGKTIEIVSFDAKQGAIFYLIDEEKVDKPVFQRAELDCTQCHIASGTRGIPGVLLRSVTTLPNGSLSNTAPQFITDQKSPWNERWGGWYVTGAVPGPSMANKVVGEVQPVANAQPAPETTPKFDASAYLTGTSDSVALMVLAHQTQMHNLITLTNYQTRLALYNLAKTSGQDPDNTPVAGPPPSLESLPDATRAKIQKPAEQLLRYLLFANETSLGGQDGSQAIKASAFAREFAAQGVRDSRKRSLRDFDLSDRIFRYPCSYLIYSSAFDELPEPARGYIYHRLLQVLSGQDQSPDFAGLSATDRQAILSILLETKPGLPAEWKDYARSKSLRVAASSSAVRQQ
jgi:hypothetical protein